MIAMRADLPRSLRAVRAPDRSANSKPRSSREQWADPGKQCRPRWSRAQSQDHLMPVEVGSSLNAPAGPDVEVAAEEQELVVARVLEDGSELRERPVHGGVGLLVQEPVEGNCRDGLVPLARNECCLPRARTRRLERE